MTTSKRQSHNQREKSVKRHIDVCLIYAYLNWQQYGGEVGGGGRAMLHFNSEGEVVEGNATHPF